MKQDDELQKIDELMTAEWVCGQSHGFVFVLRLGLTRDRMASVDPEGLWYMLQPYIEVQHAEYAGKYKEILRDKRTGASYKEFSPDMLTVIGYNVVQPELAASVGHHSRQTLVSASRKFVTDFEQRCSSELSSINTAELFYKWGKSNRAFYGPAGARVELFLAHQFMSADEFNITYKDVSEAQQRFIEKLN